MQHFGNKQKVSEIVLNLVRTVYLCFTSVISDSKQLVLCTVPYGNGCEKIY